MTSAAAAGTGILVGAAIVATRFVIDQTSPPSLALLRYLIGFVVLLPPVLFSTRVHVERRDLLAIGVLGIAQFGVLIVLLNYGLQFIPAARAALIFATLPLLAMVMAWALRLESLSVAKTAGVLLTIVGVGLALGERALPPGTNAGNGGLGELAVFTSALIGAACSVLYRPYLRRYPTLPVSAFAMLAAIGFLALLAAGDGFFANPPRFSLGGWLAILFIGVSSGVGYFLWLWALKHATPTRVTVFLALSPLTAAVLGVFLLGERFSMLTAAGLACVSLGLWAASSSFEEVSRPMARRLAAFNPDLEHGRYALDMSAMFRSIQALAPTALLFALASLALIVADLVLVAFGARVDRSNAIGRSGAIDVGSALAALSFAGVGLVLSTTRAGHGMGRLLQLIGLAIAISLFSTAYASHALVSDPTLPGATMMMWLANWIWQPMATLTLFFLPVLFPDGRLPSPRWRWGAIASMTFAVAGSIGPAFLDGPMQPPFQSRLNPVGIPQAHALMDALTKLAYVGTTILPTAGIAALVMRYRRAQSLERAQLRWFIASAIPLVIAFAITGLAYGQRGLEPIAAFGTILVVVGLIGVPSAIGFAVLRYRLYEVDLLVNRAVLYGGVTVILIAAFGVANIAAQRWVIALTGERSELVAAALGVGATLAYGPISRRLRPMVDRILPARALLTLLFTDIVGSTERVLELGDDRWRELLDRYRSTVRQTLARRGGREINTAGDAFFAVFDRPKSGVRAATEIRAAVRDLGLECRTGLHLGEVELRGEQVSGLAVHATARVMAEAKPGEILVSRELRVAVGDEEVTLLDRGRHSLKGLPDEWQLYAVEPSRV